jgi:hypothetical protein
LLFRKEKFAPQWAFHGLTERGEGTKKHQFSNSLSYLFENNPFLFSKSN